ncbi:MAG: nucleotidyltransferase substrate binding protein [Chlorobium sp.]|nr:nucleotidyltransferase substrate binding protein [Chlorobium sp.]
MGTDVRWLQRLDNLKKALDNLEVALAIQEADMVQRAGMVQFFEICFELSWNVLKDYLEAQGFVNITSPRGSIKKAFEIGLITDGSAWLKGLEDRSLTSHIYNETIARQVEELIRNRYAPLIRVLVVSMSRLEDE